MTPRTALAAVALVASLTFLLAAVAPAAHADDLTLTAPDGWVAEPPSSSFRRAQFRLPRQGQDGEHGTCVLYFFGGMAGGKDANVERWLGQWEVASGSVRDAATIEETTAGPHAVTFVEVAGRYRAPVRPMSSERLDKPGWKLLGAIIETPSGNWFVKAVGPQATLDHWRDAFRAYVLSAGDAREGGS